MNRKIQTAISVGMVSLACLFNFYYPSKPGLNVQQGKMLEQQTAQKDKQQKDDQAKAKAEADAKKALDDKAKADAQAKADALAKQKAADAQAKQAKEVTERAQAATEHQSTDSPAYCELMVKTHAPGYDKVTCTQPTSSSPTQASTPPVAVETPKPVVTPQVVQPKPTAQAVQTPKVSAKPQAQGVNAQFPRKDVMPGQKTGGVNDTYGTKQVQQGMDSMDAWATKNNLNQGH